MKRVILAPKNEEKAYMLAAKAFQDIYFAVTGIDIQIVSEDDGSSELIVIGTDAVNDWLVRPMIEGKISPLGLRYGTDDYCIRSETVNGRNVLILAGGRGRSTLYAVYDYFERFADCHYFWDGDVIPHKEQVKTDGINISESPRFVYRGLRYFAHRGLHRFQAEQWGFEDWKREIDWLVKRRLNFFMLRIGMDDLWQRVFPDEVAYPDPNETNLDKDGYRDRSVFWPLEYRGELRKRIMEYAASCDLIHPEDCGTMTHWYSPTPKDFLENHKPPIKLMPQADNQYYAPETQIWDITNQENMDNYLKLTEGYVREYNPNAYMFHTIGMGERRMMPDRASNLRLKLYAYRKIAQCLRKRYPESKLLIASWDFVGWWNSEEVQKLISELDPERTLLFDYTSDIDDPEQSFLKWGIVGRFPWIFGLFHAYEPESSLRGEYDRRDERLKTAANDPMCKGMVLWPELSHSDPLVLEYLTENAWSPLKMTIEELTQRYCSRRYGENADILNRIWQMTLPIIKLCDWGGFSTKSDDDPEAEKYIPQWDVHREMWFNYSTFIGEKSERVLRHYQYRIDIFRGHLPAIAEILEALSGLSEVQWKNPFILRDGIDIVRTVLGRYMNVLVMKAKILASEGRYGEINAVKETFMLLSEYLTAVLGFNPDFSLYDSFVKLSEESKVNKNFEHTLKGNLLDEYNRQYCYEALRYVYMKECDIAFNELMQPEKGDNSRQYEEVQSAFMSTPLEEMKPSVKGSVAAVLCKAADYIKASVCCLSDSAD